MEIVIVDRQILRAARNPLERNMARANRNRNRGRFAASLTYAAARRDRKIWAINSGWRPHRSLRQTPQARRTMWTGTPILWPKTTAKENSRLDCVCW
ncbi:hypothetical protein [Ensifer sp.]|uniref:hypothetical protein n=1 Tax=Ensifer sp. TaxID=1872086 RepID=UPI002E1176B6|nr:hypothetical protein [Ensifer sp.]